MTSPMVYARGVVDPNRRIPYGKLVFHDGSSYQLTGDDVLWTARATAYEGGEPAATLWAMTQRYAQLRRTYDTFGDFVQAFSQPVNPKWLWEGAACHPIVGTQRNSQLCDLEHVRCREIARSSSWKTLEQKAPRAVEATLQWANGRLLNTVPRATNFAAPAVAQGFLDRHPQAQVVLVAGNWYIQDSWAADWDPNRVTVLASDGAWAGTEQRATGSNGRRFWLVVRDAALLPMRLRRV